MGVSFFDSSPHPTASGVDIAQLERVDWAAHGPEVSSEFVHCFDS